jgi:hypothetical protein
MDRIRIHTNWDEYRSRGARLVLEDLISTAISAEKPKRAFVDPEHLPTKTRCPNVETARDFAGLAQRLQARPRQ